MAPAVEYLPSSSTKKKNVVHHFQTRTLEDKFLKHLDGMSRSVP
jgi:hypothetical protein